MKEHVDRVLIFRLGSIGDTVAALPALHLIAKTTPNAERWLLTQLATDQKTVPVAQILSGSGLVHGYIRYPLGARSPHELMRVRREVRAFRPDLLVYLAEPRGRFKTLRDAAFFRSCGIRRVVGLPYSRELQYRRQFTSGLVEFEGNRLLRCLHTLDHVDVERAGIFDLRLTTYERNVALAALGSLPHAAPILAASIGTKVDVNDWGDPNWLALLSHMQSELPGWAVVMLGAAIERERTDQVLKSWRGPKLNLCGTLSVRESAAALERARLFVGHDSGPMHLAAAVGTTCVVICSSRNLPGEWFPPGRQHRVLYSNVPCRGCRLDSCRRYNKMCIASISVNDVVREIEDALRGQTPVPGLSESAEW